MENSSKVLVIGSHGTLGQALIEEFSQAGYSVTGWDKDDIDITDPNQYQKIIELHPKILINSVGYNAVDKCETDTEQEQLAIKLNAGAPGKMAQVAKEIGATFVHYSTNYVFDGKKIEGYREDDTPNPVNKYGHSKLLGEQKVAEAGGNYYVIRLARLFGKRGSSPSSKRTFVEIMLAELEKPELEVGHTEFGSPTYAPDLAHFTRQLIENKQPSGIYHGANSGTCSWYEWAVEIFKILGKGPHVIPAPHSLTPKTTKHPEHAQLICTKVTPMRPWQEALHEFLVQSQ